MQEACSVAQISGEGGAKAALISVAVRRQLCNELRAATALWGGSAAATKLSQPHLERLAADFEAHSLRHAARAAPSPPPAPKY